MSISDCMYIQRFWRLRSRNTCGGFFCKINFKSVFSVIFEDVSVAFVLYILDNTSEKKLNKI